MVSFWFCLVLFGFDLFQLVLDVFVGFDLVVGFGELVFGFGGCARGNLVEPSAGHETIFGNTNGRVKSSPQHYQGAHAALRAQMG